MMQGFYINHGDLFSNELRYVHDGLKLLAKNPTMEVMQQNIVTGAVIWLVPSGNEKDIEFFFVHSGSLEMVTGNTSEKFVAGDSFYIVNLQEELFLRCLEDTTLVYVSSVPVFDAEAGFQIELARMVSQIDNKDEYTFRHSRNVMNYAVKLYTNLRQYCSLNTTDDIVVASLFHDIGKCRISDDILKKRGLLADDEYAKMKMHSVYGAELLSQYYSKSITDIVLMHHERLDGKGYPNNMKGDEIPFGARILAVADSFDAMTTNRNYNVVRSYEEAAMELASLPECYDSRVTDMLLQLVRAGEIKGETE